MSSPTAIKKGKYYKVVSEGGTADGSLGRVVRVLEDHTLIPKCVPVDGKGPFAWIIKYGDPTRDLSNAMVLPHDRLEQVDEIPLKKGDKARIGSLIKTTDGYDWTTEGKWLNTEVVIVNIPSKLNLGVGNVDVTYPSEDGKDFIDPCCCLAIDPCYLTLIELAAPAPADATLQGNSTYCTCVSPQVEQRYAGGWFDFCVICKKERK